MPHTEITVKRASTVEKENAVLSLIRELSRNRGYAFPSLKFLMARTGHPRTTLYRIITSLAARGLLDVWQIPKTKHAIFILKSSTESIENILRNVKDGHRYVLKHSINNFKTGSNLATKTNEVEPRFVEHETRSPSLSLYSTYIYRDKESSNRGGVGERTPKQQSLPLHKVNILEEKQQATSHEELNKLDDNDPVSLYEQVCKMSMSPQEMAVLTERFGKDEVRNRYKRAMKSIARCRIDHPKKGYALKTPRELTEEWCLEEMEKKQRVMRSKEEKANEVKNKQRARVKEIIEKINETSDWGHEAIQMDNSSIELVKIMPTSRGGYEGHHKTPVLYEDPELMDKLFAHLSLVNKFVNKKIDMAIFMQSGLQSSRTARVLGER